MPAGLGAAALGAWALIRVGWPPAAAWVVPASVVTFAVFGLDKLQARRGGGRVSEASLLLLSLLGGSPGALVAMPAFRHKTVKRPFRLAFLGVLVLQLGALSWWFWVAEGQIDLS